MPARGFELVPPLVKGKYVWYVIQITKRKNVVINFLTEVGIELTTFDFGVGRLTFTPQRSYLTSY